MNRIYFFTGTGNSLYVAKKVAERLGQCELVAIRKDMDMQLPFGYDRIGFVFPNYAGGPPAMVAAFIREMKLPGEDAPYYFVAATYGGNAGGLIPLTAAMFDERGLQLGLGTQIMCYPNWMARFSTLVHLYARRTNRNLAKAAERIVMKPAEHIPTVHEKDTARYQGFVSSLHNNDLKYEVNKDCVACGICRDVCPARNISLDKGIPTFHHQCEGCLSCIQHCPRAAIHYKNKKLSHRRYYNEQAGVNELSAYYN